MSYKISEKIRTDKHSGAYGLMILLILVAIPLIIFIIGRTP